MTKDCMPCDTGPPCDARRAVAAFEAARFEVRDTG
jgi:hypothetical protein